MKIQKELDEINYDSINIGDNIHFICINCLHQHPMKISEYLNFKNGIKSNYPFQICSLEKIKEKNNHIEIHNLIEYIQQLENIYAFSPKCQFNQTHSNENILYYCICCNKWMCEKCSSIHKKEEFYYCYDCKKTFCTGNYTNHIKHKLEKIEFSNYKNLFIKKDDIKLLGYFCHIHHKLYEIYYPLKKKFLCKDCRIETDEINLLTDEIIYLNNIYHLNDLEYMDDNKNNISYNKKISKKIKCIFYNIQKCIYYYNNIYLSFYKQNINIIEKKNFLQTKIRLITLIKYYKLLVNKLKIDSTNFLYQSLIDDFPKIYCNKFENKIIFDINEKKLYYNNFFSNECFVEKQTELIKANSYSFLFNKKIPFLFYNNFFLTGGKINEKTFTVNGTLSYRYNNNISIDYKIIFKISDEEKKRICNIINPLLKPKFELKNGNIYFLIDDKYICVGIKKEKNIIEINNIYGHVVLPENGDEIFESIGNNKFDKYKYINFYKYLYEEFHINQLIYISEKQFALLLSSEFILFLDCSSFKALKIIRDETKINNIYKIKLYNRIIILLEKCIKIMDCNNYQLLSIIDKGFTSIKQINNQLIAIDNESYGRNNGIHDYNWIYYIITKKKRIIFC